MNGEVSTAISPTHPLRGAPHARKGRPPLPLRPLHRMWRRTIDEIEVTKIDLPVRALPQALEGMLACQISDFHVDRDEDLERLELAVEVINRQRPEMVFLTGDYFSGPDTMRRYLGAFRHALSHLRPGIGVFAVAGNHDHWSSFEAIADAMESAGVDLLANASRRLRFRGQHLAVVGIDDLWSQRAEPSRAFKDVNPDEPTIVLAHNPDTALYLRHLAPGVMLSGHTHGGVVRIPFYGSPLRSLLRIGKQFYSGLNRYEDFYIYTNRGLGTFWLRIRINCRPEISRFSLTPLKAGAAPHPKSAAEDTDTHPVKRRARHRRPRRGRAQS